MKNRILQLKKIACAAGFALLVAGNAQAGIVNFTQATPEEVTINNGTLAPIASLTDGAVVTSLNYTVTVSDLDGDGMDDQFTVTAPFSGFGGTSNNINFDNDPTPEWDFEGGTFATGEGIDFGVITVSGTSSTGLAYQLNSALYTNFQFRRFSNAVEGATIIGDVSGTILATAGNANVALADTTFTSETTAGSNNVNNINFTVDVSTVAAAVPEPSSMAILAAGMGLFVIRRRRNK